MNYARPAPGARPRKRYRAYRSSNVPWLGEIPAHWGRHATKHAFDIQLGKMLQTAPSSEVDIEVPYLKSQHVQWNGVNVGELPTMWASPRELKKYAVVHGDLLVCEGGDVGRAALLADAPKSTIVQNALHRVRPRGENNNRFLGYVLAHASSRGWFDILCNRSTIAHFTREKFGALDIPLPPANEQHAIAGFLDRETTRIDAQIERKRQLISLLEEKRAVIITQAVAHGLNSATSLRESGVAWFGQVPRHWAIKRLRYLTPQVTVGIVITPSKYYEVEGVPALRSLNIKPGWIDDTGFVFISESSNAELAKSRLNAGDLVSVRTGNPGTTAIVPPTLHGANCIDLIITRRSNQFDSRFLCYFMNSTAARIQFEHGSGGALQQHFNIETAKNLVVPTPGLAEQAAIADHLDRVTDILSRLIAQIEKSISQLTELRASIICAAVTGRIDVRETP